MSPMAENLPSRCSPRRRRTRYGWSVRRSQIIVVCPSWHARREARGERREARGVKKAALRSKKLNTANSNCRTLRLNPPFHLSKSSLTLRFALRRSRRKPSGCGWPHSTSPCAPFAESGICTWWARSGPWQPTARDHHEPATRRSRSRTLTPSHSQRGPHSPGASPLTRLKPSAIVSRTVRSAYHGYDMRLHSPLSTRCRSGYRPNQPGAPINSPTACA
jgi:hypothetical protein